MFWMLALTACLPLAEGAGQARLPPAVTMAAGEMTVTARVAELTQLSLAPQYFDWGNQTLSANRNQFRYRDMQCAIASKVQILHIYCTMYINTADEF